MKAETVSVVVEGQTLVKDASLCVEVGEVVAVVGPNGAGKSTLFSTLSGERTPSHGRVTLAGKPLSRWPRRELAQRRAVLAQQTTLAFAFRVTDVVLMGRAPHTRGNETLEDIDIVHQTMHTLHIRHLATRSYTSLSGGEQQRVHLARVLAQVWQPVLGGYRYLLLDEPTNNLDVFHQHVTLSMVRQFAQREVGVLVILHDLNLAAQYADRVIVMKGGRIAAQGPPAEVLTPPIIQDVFSMPVRVQAHPCHDCPLVIPVPLSQQGDFS